MGFNNGYDSGYYDAKAEFAAEKAGLEKRIAELEESIAELEAGGGGSTTPAGSTILGVAPSAIVPNEDPEVPGTSTIDLSGLAVGQTAHIAEPAGVFEDLDAFFMINLPIGVTNVKIPFSDTYLDLPEGVHSILHDANHNYLNVTGLGGRSLLEYFAVRMSETELYLFFADGKID